jgi:dienelactone hydrolase
MRRLALLAVLVLAGCGGGRQAAPTVEGPFGQGAKHVTAALARIANPKLPIVAIGHSRGARLAVEWAAVAKRQPAAVLALFPGLINPSFEPPTDLSRLHRGMRIVILVGDRDRGVGNAGAAELIQRLASFGAVGQIEPGIVHSTATFSATHLSPLQTGPGARKAFWDRADRLIELSDRGDAGTK